MLKNEINKKKHQLFLFGPKCIQKSGSPKNLRHDPHTPYILEVLLNKRTELISKCRYMSKFILNCQIKIIRIDMVIA